MNQKTQSLKTAVGLYFSVNQQYNTDEQVKNRVNYTKAYLKNKVRDNIILYECMHGSVMMGNPYALFQKLLKMTDRKFIHIWVVKDVTKFDKRGYDKFKNVLFVERNSAKYMKYLTSAKYLINDTTFPPYFIKKQSQVYVNTWHGTPLKTLGKDLKGGMPSQHKNVQRNFFQTDYIVAPNAFTANVLINSHDLRGIYTGKIIEEGYPRIDATYQTEREPFLRDVLGQAMKIDPNKEIVLYAPTWRGGMGTSQDITAELIKITKEIQEKLPKTHQLILKLHPITMQFLAAAPELQKICVPDTIDPNELLSVVDVLITDYSSIFFDFYVTRKPIILFAYDYSEYEVERGLYLDIQTLGVDVAFTTDTLLAMLTKATQRKKPLDYDEAIGRYAYRNLDGTTTDRYIDIIFNQNETDYNVYTIKNAKKNIVIYGGGMLNNGMTSSFINLTHTIDYNKFNLIMIIHDDLSEESIKNLSKINDKVKILYRESSMDVTTREFVYFVYSLRKYNETYIKKFNIPEIYRREFKRIFGNIRVDTVIDYCGYTSFWSQLFAYCGMANKIIYQHSDMWEESQKKIDNKLKHKTQLNIIFQLYHKFDAIACIGEKTMETNIKKLKKFVTRDKFIHIPNSLDSEHVLKSANSFEYVEVPIHERNYLLNISKASHVVSGFLAPHKGNTVFINVGSLSPEKDHLKLIKVFEKLFKEHTQYQDTVQLYIIGEGVLEEELQSKINDAGLSQSIILTGQLENPFPLMKKGNCYISSANYEGQSMAMLEALVLKKDVIATNIDGNIGILQDECGTLVENSIDGLYHGIINYLEKKQTKKKVFNAAAYEQNGKLIFEDVVLAENRADIAKQKAQ